MKKFLGLALVIVLIVQLQSAESYYTSLVLDCSHLDLQRSESPKILSERGYEVYGTIFENLDKALEMGVFFYAPSLEQAKKYDRDRIGSNPLMVKGKRVTGSARTDVVISDLDALKILKENKKSHFLDSFKVIVLVGQPSY